MGKKGKPDYQAGLKGYPKGDWAVRAALSGGKASEAESS